ncbi:MULTISPECIES: hypothetical protein [Enorma]|uniref:hypothetical protein n=1 Tax=Enorma TaxID=1472762 RepID=UPI000345B349|nr:MULTISPECIES: hypothetical protein [Enorma]
MDLFIETPRQVSERRERELRAQGDRRDALQGVPDVASASSGCGAASISAGGRVGGEACACQDAAAAAGRAQGFQAVAPHGAGHAGNEPYSVAQEAYREELAFDKRRTCRRKRLAVLRVVRLIIGIPLLLAVVFVGSYVCTCILNGATPEEVAELLGEMAGHVTSFFAQLG